jgi:ATP-dependent Clp protease ATP-binding subunit ClpX
MTEDVRGKGDDGKLLYCSFCGKSQHEVRKLIAGPSVFVCDECVELCNDIIREELEDKAEQGREKLPRPHEIKTVLDDYVIGQERAKKTLAVAVYNHYKRLQTRGATNKAKDDVEIAKSNVLLIGPSGSGKTLMCETLSRVLGVPFVTANATSLAQARFVNDEIEAILQRLLEKAGDNINRAQQGIIFIDEIDKLKATPDQPRATSGESVQHALLKIMEGAPVKIGDGRFVDTTNMLFICGGAFVGIEDIMAKTHGYGFLSTTAADDPGVLDRLNSRVKPTDLFQFGLIPEFTGRLPIIARFQELEKKMLIRILTEPKNSIYNQFREILKNEGVELNVADKVFGQIADIAIEYKTGARSLRGIFEELITPILYLMWQGRNNVTKVGTASGSCSSSSPTILPPLLRASDRPPPPLHVPAAALFGQPVIRGRP